MKHLLAFKCRTDGIVEVVCDRDGLTLLIKRLQLLLSRGGHEHLMTPSWSGNELTEMDAGSEEFLAHQVNFYVRSHKETEE